MAYGLGGRGGEADESVLCMSLLPWSGLTRRPCVVSALVMYGCRRVSYGRPFVEVSVVPPVYRSVCVGLAGAHPDPLYHGIRLSEVLAYIKYRVIANSSISNELLIIYIKYISNSTE